MGTRASDGRESGPNESSAAGRGVQPENKYFMTQIWQKHKNVHKHTFTCIHSLSSRHRKPQTVLEAGSNISWANEVTSSVLSVPSEPCTSTEWPSLQKRSMRYILNHAKWQSYQFGNVMTCLKVTYRPHTVYAYLSTHSAIRPVVDRALWTWESHLEFSSLLSQRSTLCDESPHASTSLMRLSCRTLPL